MRMYNPAHPGEVLKDMLTHIGSVEDFKTKIGIDQRTLTRLVECEMPISEDLSAKIGAYFGQEPGLWFRMSQSHYEWQAKHPKQ